MIKLKILLEKTKQKDWQPLTSDEYAEAHRRFGKELKCSIGKDKNGYFCYTHRARSKSKESINKIPIKDYKFICSTG